MKRLIASRKLQRRCIYCDKEFKKSDVYYKERTVYTDYTCGFENLIAFETLMCPKCKYKQGNHNIRHKEFQRICIHPDKFIEKVWQYIPGECVKEPAYDYCRLCGTTLL